MSWPHALLKPMKSRCSMAAGIERNASPARARKSTRRNGSLGSPSMHITRRSFGLAALGGMLVPALPAIAKAPFAGTQAAGVNRLRVGGFELTVLNDGWLPIETKLF